MTKEDFHAQIAKITSAIADKSVDATLGDFLNTRFGTDSDAFKAIMELCQSAIEDGWMCENEHGGVKYGRVLEASPATNGFSVDVVQMTDMKGPYHGHPGGEIDMIMPIDNDAQFDGMGAGWLVYDAASAHYPTVSGGSAVVLYLLPGGAIDFKATPPD